jgi:hypothetical protein
MSACPICFVSLYPSESLVLLCNCLQLACARLDCATLSQSNDKAEMRVEALKWKLVQVQTEGDN